MANFEKAYAYVYENEKGHDNDPDDPGGETVDGVTLAFLRDVGIDVDGDGDIDIADIQALVNQPEKTKQCYKFRWDRWRLSEIKSQDLATKVFDLAVNTGFTQCVLFVQRALNSTGFNLTVDGKLGPKTIQAFQRVDQDPLWRQMLLAALRSEAGGFYRLIAFKNPALKKFIVGWTRRAYQ